MSDEKRIADIRARLAAASPGPWEGGEDVGGVGGFLGVVDADGEVIISATETVAHWPDPDGPAVFDPQELADVEFISNAPADVRDLLAMLDSTRSCSLAEGTTIAGPCGVCLECVTRSRDSARLLAESERQRAEVAEITLAALDVRVAKSADRIERGES